LYLQFRIAAQRYALVCRSDRGAAAPPLKPIAQAPAWVAGVFAIVARWCR
jgi:chemotaxis-related protein WspB